ncbi:PAS domain-containing hybrid sensor histidine kinase/response regulator [Pararhodospirillum oryzae]|uniref:histidine kinase n=1 Tax=Pararhodospirillum oryzae TaxID=478448 RepID=A0A512HBV2_9PROT|nr:ATP-binding protein [Pararhodospirillum oryzae]GEO82929.1 hybrid sensor histidine kinase/response regulator [Pararhodospirillum oryzae]
MTLDHRAALRALLAHADNDIVLVDPAGQVLAASGRAAERLGARSVEAAVGRDALAGLAPRLAGPRRAALHRVLACGVAETLEDHLGDGWWTVRFTPVPAGTEAGNVAPVAVLVSARDISRERALALALADSEERFDSTFDAAGHGMALLGSDGRFVRINPALSALLGLDPGAPGDLAAAVFPGDLKVARDLLHRLFAGQAYPLSLRMRFLDATGAVVWTDVGATVPRHRPGEPVCAVLQIRDVTQEHRVDERLRAAKDEAERASRAKTRFLAAASHDLRQPLQALAMFIAVLAGRETDSRNRALIERIEKTTEALTGLLNTLLDISRLDAGLMRCEPRDVPLGPLLARLVEEVQPLAAGRGLEMRWVPTRLAAHADPALVEIIVRNLLGNAVRYTPQGRIVLGVRRRAGGRVEIQVVDTGTGIPADQQALVFEDFHQVENPAREKGEGLGLGLAIVKRVSALLGAPVTLVSHPGRGTRVGLTLPGPQGGRPDTAIDDGLGGIDPAGAQGLSVMVIDDDPAILDGLTLVLEGWDCDVLAFEDIRGLREGLASGGLLAPPDVIIADYRLDGAETGVEAVALIREAVGEPVPAVLLTGDTAPQRLREADASGLPVLHKPVKPDALRAVLADLVAGGLTLTDWRAG